MSDASGSSGGNGDENTETLLPADSISVVMGRAPSELQVAVDPAREEEMDAIFEKEHIRLASLAPRRALEEYAANVLQVDGGRNPYRTAHSATSTGATTLSSFVSQASGVSEKLSCLDEKNRALEARNYSGSAEHTRREREEGGREGGRVGDKERGGERGIRTQPQTDTHTLDEKSRAQRPATTHVM